MTAPNGPRPGTDLDQRSAPAEGRKNAGAVRRVRAGHVEWVRARLSERDWQIIHSVNQLRILSGSHIEILFFDHLPSPRSRVVSRSRTLSRLVAWRVLVPLERRIGGQRGGSSTSLFALDSAGQRLIAEAQQADAAPMRVRRPGTPSERTVWHQVAVSELYVRLVGLARQEGFTVADYQAEPACWWRSGIGGHIKPDAYLRLELGEVVDHWWVEVDMATESLPTLRRKLESYLDFVRRGQVGPGGVVPRVLVSTISVRRQVAVAELVGRLPPPAKDLFVVVHSAHAAKQLNHILHG